MEKNIKNNMRLIMRESLYKGLTKYDGRWVEGQLIIDKHIHNDNFNTYCIAVSPQLFQKCANEHKIIGGTYLEVLPESIGQYTYKKDKEDTKIFEGDFVDIPKLEMVGEVVWNETLLQFTVYDEDHNEHIPLCEIDNRDMRIVGVKYLSAQQQP